MISNKKRCVLLFANTLWFISKFKESLIEKLIKENYEVKILYLRPGPSHSNEFFKRNKIICLSYQKFLILYFKNFFKQNIIIKRNMKLLTFTIGPVILAGFYPFNKLEKFATLEGLGRVFSSRKIHMRITKLLVIRIYRYIFKKNYKSVFVLNYLDFAYLLENKIVPIKKLNIIPGTGVDSSIYNPMNLNLKRIEMNLLNKDKSLKINDMFITFIGRISEDKGFFRFISAALFLLNDKKFNNLLFRIVSPISDINKIDSELKTYLINKNFDIKPYINDPIEYYSEAKVIVLPTIYGEGLSRVALEAGFLGIPLAAVHNRGISSLFIDGISGELTMDHEPYGISRIIKKICENYDQYLETNPNVYKNLVLKYDNFISTNSVFKILDS